MLPLRQRLEALRIVAQFDGRRPLTGMPMHGLFRAPRTATGESCGSLQYRLSGVSMTAVSSGERHADGGRKPVVHTAGSPMPAEKSPNGNAIRAVGRQSTSA